LPLPPTPSPRRRGGAERSSSPSPLRGGGRGEGFHTTPECRPLRGGHTRAAGGRRAGNLALHFSAPHSTFGPFWRRAPTTDGGARGGPTPRRPPGRGHDLEGPFRTTPGAAGARTLTPCRPYSLCKASLGTPAARRSPVPRPLCKDAPHGPHWPVGAGL